MTITLTKEPAPEITGPIVISAEWNHSCTPQCPADCDAEKNLLRPGVGTRVIMSDDDNGPAIPKVPHPRDPKD